MVPSVCTNWLTWLLVSLWVPKVMFWFASYSACVIYTETIIRGSFGESDGY